MHALVEYTIGLCNKSMILLQDYAHAEIIVSFVDAWQQLNIAKIFIHVYQTDCHGNTQHVLCKTVRLLKSTTMYVVSEII